EISLLSQLQHQNIVRYRGTAKDGSNLYIFLELVTQVDASGSVKLADFGLAKVSQLNSIKSCKGTPFWLATEVINLKRTDGYESSADIWSLGCTVLEMLTRQIPYADLENPVQALFRIERGELPDIPDTLSLDARDFIIKFLKVNPEERPTAAELLNHPFASSGSS
ncbi:hypothetical protein F2Q69_00047007, partial [Brassica cretica]